jgi:hypothetical protein
LLYYLHGENWVPYSFYVYEIEDIIAEINRRLGTCVEFHPSWKYPIWVSARSLEFKLRDRTATGERIFDLVVPENQFVPSSSRSKRLTSEAADRITQQIESFFGFSMNARGAADSAGNTSERPPRRVVRH